MAIKDFATLSQAIASWLHRDDLGDIIPELILLAGEQLSLDLDARVMEARTTLSLSGGAQYVSLPDDLKSVRRITITSAQPLSLLQYVTPDQISNDYAMQDQGIPRVFTIIGTQMQLAPIPDVQYQADITYQKTVPSLTGDPGYTTNWLLRAYPGAYLFAALSLAQPYVMNDDRAAMFASMYQAKVAAINSANWNSGAPMRVRAS